MKTTFTPATRTDTKSTKERTAQLRRNLSNTSLWKISAFSSMSITQGELGIFLWDIVTRPTTKWLGIPMLDLQTFAAIQIGTNCDMTETSFPGVQRLEEVSKGVQGCISAAWRLHSSGVVTGTKDRSSMLSQGWGADNLTVIRGRNYRWHFPIFEDVLPDLLGVVHVVDVTKN